MLPPSRLDPVAAAAGRAEVAAAARVRGVGRPPGARNLATKQVKEFIVKMFGDPMIESARWLLHTPASLGRELGITVVEAFDRQQRIREALMPFIHAKIAPVGEDGRAMPFFQLIMGASTGADRAGLAPWLDDPEIAAALEHEGQQNQGVSDADREKSYGESPTEPARR
jgi:hypothetical protein